MGRSKKTRSIVCSNRGGLQVVKSGRIACIRRRYEERGKSNSWYIVRHVLKGKGGVVIFDETGKAFGTLAISF